MWGQMGLGWFPQQIIHILEDFFLNDGITDYKMIYILVSGLKDLRLRICGNKDYKSQLGEHFVPKCLEGKIETVESRNIYV